MSKINDYLSNIQLLSNALDAEEINLEKIIKDAKETIEDCKSKKSFIRDLLQAVIERKDEIEIPRKMVVWVGRDLGLEVIMRKDISVRYFVKLKK